MIPTADLRNRFDSRLTGFSRGGTIGARQMAPYCEVGNSFDNRALELAGSLWKRYSPARARDQFLHGSADCSNRRFPCMPTSDDPHANASLHEQGASLDDATVAMILLHGRGASAQGILALAQAFETTEVAYLAPQAVHRSWYPESFMAPIDQNEPELSSALKLVGETIEQVRDAGLNTERTILLGFSQGACLATEYAARNPQRYGGVVGLSGGLIGPDGTTFDFDGTLDGTPIFLGCSDQDPYIPLERVEETAEVFRGMSAKVTKQIYEGMGHTTNEDELRHIRALLDQYVDLPSASVQGDADDE